MTRHAKVLFRGALLTLLASVVASAQTAVPFHVVGGGTADCISAIPGEFTNFNGVGQATLLVDYELVNATVGVTNYLTAPGVFPAVAEFGNEPIRRLCSPARSTRTRLLHYSGIVTLTPVDPIDPSQGFDALFIADFVPVVGSGQGVFADVIGGSFEMTANSTQPFIPKGLPPLPPTLDPPYEWFSDGGALLFVPEPSAVSLVSLICLAGTIRKWFN